MKIETIPGRFAVCRLRSVPQTAGRWHFLSVTDGEISLVCPEADVPEDAEKADRGWRAFRVKGPLDFSRIGILADLSARLADARIGLFAVSTYDTDYILTREEQFDKALAELAHGGYDVQK